VHEHELAALVQELDRLHERAALCSPVAGIHVDVYGPETGRAVVREPVAGDRMATLTATEILAGAREARRQEAPRFVEPNGSAPGGSVCGIAIEGAGVRSSKSVPPGRTVARQTGGVPSFRERLEARLQALPDVQRSASAFGDEDAYWVNGKEVLHFDAPDVVDVRLTRAEIRIRRQELREDSRVQLRRSSSADWIEVRFATAADVDFVVQLAEVSAAAHRARDGSTARPPPSGADLERRRRFH
jgi:Luciferase